MKTYSAKDHTLNYGGVDITGLADDFLVAARNEDGFTDVPSADGEITRNKNANQSGTVTITLKNSSSANTTLGALALADEVNGGGVTSFVMLDLLGNTVISGAECWVRKLPDINRGKEVGETVWVIAVAKLVIVPGGNNDV
jgi:hypothetical protein